MRIQKLQELLGKGFITEEQFVKAEAIETRKVVSVFYELRVVLYLGVMLFTTGAGILIYMNIGEIGHTVSITALIVLTIVCFLYVFRYAVPFSDEKITSPTPYFDYIVLSGCLLFISVLTYLQIQYNLFYEGLGATTLLTSAFFFFVAYRFDHLGVLSLAITAVASFFSISLSPQKWYSGDFLENADLHLKGMLFGVVLMIIAILLHRKKIKEHFTFTYINFGALTFLTGALAGLLMDAGFAPLYLLALYAGCAFAAFYGHVSRSFLFLLYAFVFGYTGTTYYLADTSLLVSTVIWFFYLLLSCGGFIIFILRYKRLFKRTV